MPYGIAVLAVSYNSVGGMGFLLQISFGMTPLATLLLSLGSAKLVLQIGSGFQSSLLHHEVSLMGVR